MATNIFRDKLNTNTFFCYSSSVLISVQCIQKIRVCLVRRLM